MADRDPTLERKLAQELRRLPREALRELEQHVDSDLPSTLADPAWSRGAVRMLDGSARAALRLLCGLPRGARTDHLDAMAALIADEGPSPSRQLVSAGIAFAESDEWDRRTHATRIHVLAPLASRWCSLAEDPAIADPPPPRDEDDAFLAQRAAFELGATLAAIRSLRPRASRVSGVHKSDFKALRSLLNALFPDENALAAEVERLERNDLLIDVEGRLDVDHAVLAEWTDALSARFAVRAHEERHRHGFLAALGALAAHDRWLSWPRVAELVALANLKSLHAVDSAAGVRETLNLLANLPGLLRAEAGGVEFLRLSTSIHKSFEGDFAFRPEARLLVQPNLQVTAPLGASTQTLVTLARFCRLVSVDRVAVFALDEAACRRAAVNGLDASRILGFLEQRASHGVPSNVARAVIDWARTRGHVRMASGIAIATEVSLEDLRRFVGDRVDVQPFAPGVYLVDAGSAHVVERALREAGVAIESTVSGAAADRHRADPPRARLSAIREEARGALVKLA